MEYDLATNFDDKLIERVAEFETVKSVYGKLPADIVGGGRPTIVLPNINRKDIKKHIETCHKHGIEFNYLLNASCMDNKELTAEGYKEIIKLIEQVQEDGANSLTVSNIPLLGIIKNHFPDLKVSTSIYMRPSTINEVLSLEEMGADEITLCYSFNRNFPKLKKVLDVKKPTTSLRLIANNTCLHDCPYRVPGHANFLAHSSQQKHESKGFALDIFTVMCGLKKLENLGEIFMSEWIRPEDVSDYEELGRNLVLKLTDRARTTDWLVRAVRAYSEQNYDGNLFDILNWMDGKYKQTHIGPMIKGALKGKAKIQQLLKLKTGAFLPEIYVDNRQLEGFLEHFKKSPCEDRVCYSRSPQNADCNYCETLAERLVKINEQEKQSSISRKQEIITAINSGEMFGK
ncbi:MAG: hypothetical protein ABIG37_02495 [Nanoarchaeota archaeon]|nr:hypothetical protein [Nanoarchaeota archaeon]